MSFGVDVTARKQTEGLLLETESRLRSVLENDFDGIAVVVEGRIAYANPPVSQMWGYDTTRSLVPSRQSFSSRATVTGRASAFVARRRMTSRSRLSTKLSATMARPSLWRCFHEPFSTTVARRC